MSLVVGKIECQGLADDDRHPGLTSEVVANGAQAARVCLQKHHKSPAPFRLEDPEPSELEVSWTEPTEREIRSWANQDDAARDGAYILAISVAEQSRQLFAVRRAETRTGADYYLAPAGANVDDIEGHLRLEVTGSNSIDGRYLARRLVDKLSQLKNGKGNLPALATVVGFKARVILVAEANE